MTKHKLTYTNKERTEAVYRGIQVLIDHDWMTTPRGSSLVKTCTYRAQNIGLSNRNSIASLKSAIDKKLDQ